MEYKHNLRKPKRGVDPLAAVEVDMMKDLDRIPESDPGSLPKLEVDEAQAQQVEQLLASDGGLGSETDPAKPQTVTMSLSEIVAQSSPPMSLADQEASPSDEGNTLVNTTRTHVPSNPGSGTLRDQLSHK